MENSSCVGRDRRFFSSKGCLKQNLKSFLLYHRAPVVNGSHTLPGTVAVSLYDSRTYDTRYRFILSFKQERCALFIKNYTLQGIAERRQMKINLVENRRSALLVELVASQQCQNYHRPPRPPRAHHRCPRLHAYYRTLVKLVSRLSMIQASLTDYD